VRLISDDALAVATIWQEARGEDFEGKVGVAEVIRNRAAGKKSIASIVLKPFQFSGWNTKDGNRVPSMSIDDTDPVVQSCQEAWLKALDGSDLTQGAEYYMNVDLVKQMRGELPAWVHNLEQTVIIGNHTFWRRPSS